MSSSAYSQVIENTNAGYINVHGELSLGGMPLKMNVGVRDEYTNVTTIGLGQQPTSLTVQPSDHTAFLVGFGPTSPVTGHNSYQYLLPNVDLALDRHRRAANPLRRLPHPDAAAAEPDLRRCSTSAPASGWARWWPRAAIPT